MFVTIILNDRKPLSFQSDGEWLILFWRWLVNNALI